MEKKAERASIPALHSHLRMAEKVREVETLPPVLLTRETVRTEVLPF
jgi:hypothetical protein